ncbi:C3HC zinc finger-like-domain-containing protein [Aspergillus ambiguus]|uniref:uncharacterized protein n=1 Tax=Aspergillus ambiguus TaxID=176160 RepID=UPI003CCE21A7
MSYAVETKKRKFHRVLESLTQPSTPDSATKPSSTTAKDRSAADFSLKRPRLGRDDGSELATARRAILKVTRAGSRASSTSSSSRPTFVPWDRERFLERLETFRRVNWWSPKPAAINEVEWAKRGWICTDASRVTCVGGCGGSVVVKLPDELDELDGYDMEKVQERKEVRAKLVDEYVSLLLQGHAESCPWKNRSCDATIHRLPLANPDTAITGLQSRYSRVAKLADQLPAQDIIQSPDSFDIEEMLSIFPVEKFQDPEPQADGPEAHTVHPTSEAQETPQNLHPTPLSVNKTAFSLAFFGWDTVSDGAAGLLGCRSCFRRLGLWMYRPKENGGAPLYDSLDLAQEHMEYCPWICGTAQSGTGKASDKEDDLASGWQLLAQALKVKHRRHIRSSTSGHSRAPSEAPSTDSFAVDETNDEARKASDREWWAKLRRIRHVLKVKAPERAKPSTH